MALAGLLPADPPAGMRVIVAASVGRLIPPVQATCPTGIRSGTRASGAPGDDRHDQPLTAEAERLTAKSGIRNSRRPALASETARIRYEIEQEDRHAATASAAPAR
jgi:hypothetical protein